MTDSEMTYLIAVAAIVTMGLVSLYIVLVVYP